MTVLKISQQTLIQLPQGATGAAVEISYNGTTTGSVVASGYDKGRAVIVDGRLAKLTGLDKASPLQVVGREAGGRMPARVTLRIYPEGSGVVSPIVLSGLPIGSPDAPGIWDLSNIDDASGGLDVVLPGERQRLAMLMEGASTARVAAETAAQSAGTAEAKANTAIANLNSQVEGAAAQAAAGTVARVNGALADIAQSTELNNAATAQNLGRKTAPSVAEIGAEPGLYNITGGSDAGQVWERLPDGSATRRSALEAASSVQLRAQAARLEIATLADLLAASDLSAPSTVIVQQAIVGGTFAIRAGQNGDGVLAYNLPNGLTAHRLLDDQRIITAWAGLLPGGGGQQNRDAMQLSLDVARSRNIRRVYTVPGEYAWAGGAVETYANIEAYGTAEYTVFKAGSDTGFFKTTQPKGDYATPGVRITNMVLRREAFPTRTWEIDLLDVSHPLIENVTIDCWGHVSDRTAVSGARVRVSRDGNTFQPIKKDTFLAEFINVRCLNGSIDCENTDSKIVMGIAWGQMREYAICARDTANLSVDGTEIIASPVHGGVYALRSTAVQVTSATRFDGSYDHVASGWGFFADGGGGHLIDGHFYNSIYGSVQLKNTHTGSDIRGTHVDGNRINDPACVAIDADGKNYPDVLLENSSGNKITVGKHNIARPRDRAGGGGSGLVVEERGTSSSNVIVDGTAIGNYDWHIVSKPSENSVLRGFIGTAGTDITRRKITVQWLDGNGTQVGTRHGLPYEPRTVLVRPLTLLGNATQWCALLNDDGNVYIRLNTAPQTIAPQFEVLCEL